ncbi:MAG: hypothetical protein IKO03_03910 [Lachnospiraceae bacterium]|nr:hypothetical protein [Lachnospiraceae bacterium]
MKKRIAMMLSYILILFCMLQNSVVHANGADIGKITEPYDYPIKPGTEEWRALPSVVERREACEIPQEVLGRMTTDALAESVITYPFLIDALGCFGSFETGINWIATYFSGIDELLSRPGACDSLREYLVREKDRYDTLSAMDLSDKTIEQMRKCCEYECAIQLLEYIESQTSDELEIGTTRYYLTVTHTPKGSDVDVYAGFTWDIHNKSYLQAVQEFQVLLNNYPSASEVYSDSCNPSYNCHSYAWYSQLSSNTYWINDPAPYITDGSYISTYPTAGCRIVYYNSNYYIPNMHSGIIQTVGASPSTTTEKSKWGCYGLCSHYVDDCPYYSSSALSYWVLNPN